MQKLALFSILLFSIVVIAFVPASNKTQRTTLKDAFECRFYIGTALNSDQITGRDTLSCSV